MGFKEITCIAMDVLLILTSCLHKDRIKLNICSINDLDSNIGNIDTNIGKKKVLKMKPLIISAFSCFQVKNLLFSTVLVNLIMF